MSVVFDKVTAEVAAPAPEASQENAAAQQQPRPEQFQREVLQAIERNECLAQRLKAD